MDKHIVKILEDNHSSLFVSWKEDLFEITKKEKLLEESIRKESPLIKELFNTIVKSIKTMDMDSNSDFQEFYAKIIMYNGSLDFITQGFQTFRRLALKILLQEEELPRETILHYYEEIDQWFDPVLLQVVNDCSQNWEDTFNKQEETLKELSAPIIQLFEGIAVLPLVGMITDSRTKNITENVLNGIMKYHTSYIFIDITGVPIVDTYVAQVVIDTTKMAKLLGTECIIVGIRPEIAQTMINLGIDLSEFKTFSSLSRGLFYAMKDLNLPITNM